MLAPRLYLRRAARTLARGGFTLVELLVVIGIIAILAGVALGPITNGIKKAKQSAGVQSAHAIGLAMYSASNDNSQLYPDFTGGTAANVGQALLGGGYVTDPGIFWLSGDTSGGYKYSSSAPAATGLVVSNISWDFISAGGSGVTSTNYTYLPLFWSTLSQGSGLPSTITPQSAITATAVTKSPFGTDGIAIFYINNSAAFVTGSITSSTTSTVTLLSSTNNTQGGGTGYTLTNLQGL